MGAGVGAAQWFVLRRVMHIDKRWMWFSIIGMGIPFLVMDLFLKDMLTHKLPLEMSISAVLVSLLQFNLLKSHFSKAYWWIFGCTIGWCLAVATVFTIDYTNGLKEVIHSNLALAGINLLLILSGGIVLGIVTGVLMKRILNEA